MAHGSSIRSLVHLRRWLRETGGTAAIEFALIVGVMSYALLNCVDLARYYHLRNAVENATQMAAQQAWATCDTAHLPATTNCTGLTTAITASLQSTALGSAVTQVSGSPAEGYYCVNSSGVLVYVAAVNAKPANCASVGNATASAGDYLKISTTYTFTPLFPGTSISSLLPTAITATTFMRLQ